MHRSRSETTFLKNNLRRNPQNVDSELAEAKSCLNIAKQHVFIHCCEQEDIIPIYMCRLFRCVIAFTEKDEMLEWNMYYLPFGDPDPRVPSICFYLKSFLRNNMKVLRKITDFPFMHLSEEKIKRINEFIRENQKFAFDIIEKKKKLFPGVYAYVKWMLLIIKYMERIGFKEQSKLKLIDDKCLIDLNEF